MKTSSPNMQGQWPPAQDLPYLASIPPLSPPTSTGEPRATERQSVLNLVNCLLGAGILGYPYCFRSCGIGLATAIMAVSILAGRLSYQLLLHCAHLTQRRSYEELAQAALGRAGRWTVEICTAALNLGAVVAYLNVLADVLSAVAGTLIPPGAEPSRQSYIAGVTLFGALPVALVVRDHSVVGTFAAASVGFVILFAAVILVLALSPAATAAATAVAAATAATGTAATAASAVKMWEMEGLLVAFPVMAYGFTAHPYYLPIYSMLQAPSLPRMARVTDAAIALCALLYWAVGAGGYLVFRQRTSGDVLRNFGGPHVHGLRGAYERALKLCYGFAILGAIPLVIQPFYSLLLPVLGGGGSGGRRSHKDRAAARATVRKDSNYGLVNDDDEEGATAWQRQQQEARLLLGSQGSGLLSFGARHPSAPRAHHSEHLF